MSTAKKRTITPKKRKPKQQAVPRTGQKIAEPSDDLRPIGCLLEPQGPEVKARDWWSELAPDKQSEIVHRYEVTCDNAYQRTHRRLAKRNAKAEAAFKRMCQGAREAVAAELLELGCPQKDVLDAVIEIAKRATQIAARKTSAGSA